MSRAHTAAIGVFRKKLFTFDFGNDFHILLADIGTLNRSVIKAAISTNADMLKVGPIQFNLRDCSANLKGMQIGPQSWITSEYSDTLIMCSLPATRDEIVYLVKSLIHLLESN